MTLVYLIESVGMPIFEQLQLEEALLRADMRNFVLINQGSSQAIVSGLSGEPDQLCDLQQVQSRSIPMIRRYSGGGTVFVDKNSLFVSLIFSKKDISVAPFPEPIMRWSFDLYQKAWNIPGFRLVDNDYTIENRKCGGNAQYFSKDRLVHHTTFLWDFLDENMDVLRQPVRQPPYRQNRSHCDFLCRLKDAVPSQEFLAGQLKNELVKRFDIRSISHSELNEIQKREYRISTQKTLPRGV